MSGGRDWTTSEVRKLHELRGQPIRMQEIARALGRSEQAVYSFLRYVPAKPGRCAAMGRTGPRKKHVTFDPSERLRRAIVRRGLTP